jgi:hypothetical protein
VRSSRLLALASLIGALMMACSKPKSFIVLTMHSAEAAPITPVTEVVVTVKQGSTLSITLTYPPQDGNPLTIDQGNTNNLSVSFTGARSGTVDLTVSAKNAAGCTIGFLALPVLIRQGGVTSATVDLAAQTECTTPADGGVDAGGDAFPGCDPVTPACMPGDTCQVNCKTRSGQCTQGGTGAPGTICVDNRDCAPGSQCFDYSGAGGCNVKVCLRFCNGDQRCSSSPADAGTGAEAGTIDGGGADGDASSRASGPQSLCQGLVPCPSGLTAYHTCTFACDPRATAATAHTSGCPEGLSCLVVGNMDQVDCACAESSRKGKDGEACASGSQCAPGYICNMMGSTQTCRAVCRCDAKGMSCTAANDCGGGKTCSALTNDTTFGVCL